MKAQKGFTLIELIAVIIVIGVLISLAIGYYNSAKENTIDKEAFSSLKMLRVAEKSYYMDYRIYYEYTGSDMTNINDNLKVFLVTGNNRNWDYKVYSSGCSQATRYNGPNTRSWCLTIGNDGDPLDCDASPCPP